MCSSDLLRPRAGGDDRRREGDAGKRSGAGMFRHGGHHDAPDASLPRLPLRPRKPILRVWKSPISPEGRRVSTASRPKTLDDILQEFSQHRKLMQEELQKVIVGQNDVIEQLFAAIFTRGHCLLEGVPGLAKTLMVSTLARILDVGFKRVQFTPDLMPSDITGTNVLEEDDAGRRRFRFVEGPIFTNILLADEI